MLQTFPKPIDLKDGTALVLRPMQAEDLERLHAFFCALPEEDRLYLRDDVTDRKLIERWIAQMDHARVFPLLALQGERVVGDASLHLAQFGWTQHVGEIRCAVARELQNKGLGTLLVAELVQQAMQRGIQKLSVSIMDRQQRAHRTFERIGFRTVASLPGYVKDLAGTERDLAIMLNEPEDVWRRLQELMTDLDFSGERASHPMVDAGPRAAGPPRHAPARAVR